MLCTNWGKLLKPLIFAAFSLYLFLLTFIYCSLYLLKQNRFMIPSFFSINSVDYVENLWIWFVKHHYETCMIGK